MRSILLKGMDHSYKSNMILHKSFLGKNNVNNNQIKKPIKLKLLLPRKSPNPQDKLYPSSINYKKIIENSYNKKNPYCITENNIDTDRKNDNNYYKKLNLLPKIKENNKYYSKKNIYLGSNKYSLNLNYGTSALSCGKILFDKNKELNETKEKDEKKYPYIKKLALKEMVFNKNKSEKRGRTIGNLVRIKKQLNFPKREDQNMNKNMNDIIISNDFHGSKLINFEENWKRKFDKLNVYMKYQQKNYLNKRSGNNNEMEKNQSIDAISINKKKHFKSFQNLSQINSPKKISKTIHNTNAGINNTEIKNNLINNSNDINCTDIKNNLNNNPNNNLYTLNIQRYIPKKIRHNNDDIINLLNDSNN